jgi:hypothetical protein
VAMGELQLRVGPDQRATASADILEETNNPYTLVWHSDSSKGWDNSTRDWSDSGSIADFALPLVSVNPTKLGNLIKNTGEFDEALLDNTDSPAIELMKVTNPSDGTLTSLKGERRPLIDPNGAVTGNYAWVAQDESLKANLKTEHGGTVTKDANGDIVDSSHELALVETSRRLSVFPYANAAGVEMPDGSTPFSSIDPVAADGSLNSTYFEKIEKAATLSDLITSEILQPASTTGTTAEKLAPYQNHFTLNSKGMLADTKNGGLRRDLSRGLDDQYFEKLHEVPVFGVDRDGNVTADGISEPVGDQWKLLRDYYNFYLPTDDGLVSDLGNTENTFYGLTDATGVDPSVRMRITHPDIAHGLNFMYTSSNNATRYANETPSYSTPITPLTPTPASNPKRDSSITNDDWFLLTPQVRPVVLRNTLKIGLYFEEITDSTDPDYSSDPADPNYRMRITAFPTFTLWNPFNVAIDLTPGSSPNPMAQGSTIKFNQSGNIDLFIQKNDELLVYPMPKIAPNIEIDPDSAAVPDEMPPGAVWVFGLEQSHTKDANDFIWVKLGLVRSGSVNDLNNVTNQVDQSFTIRPKRDSEGNIIYENGVPVTEEVTIKTIFKGSDQITLLETDNKTHFNEYVWRGIITSGSTDYACFNTGENSDIPKPDYVDNPLYLDTVAEIDQGDGFTPLVTINFIANTTQSQTNNPEFPAFAQVNFLGATPQVVAEQDAVGDVKALYHRERYNATGQDFSDIFPPNNGLGNGFYGASFSSAEGETAIALYDFPRHPIISITDLKNLTLGWTEDTHARPIGASWPLATLFDLSNPYIRSVAPNGYGTNNWGDQPAQYLNGAGCDTSYYYNDALFDSYFFSGIPSEDRDDQQSWRKQTFPYDVEFDDAYIDSAQPTANTRLSYYNSPDIKQLRNDDGFEQAAAHLMIDAPFNVNSTSPQAWQAILSGFRGQDIAGINAAHSSTMDYSDTGTPFVDHFIPSNDSNNLYSGHRRLKDDEMANFSVNLVDEIRTRGIATSLGAFVNRDLNGSLEQQQMGRIEAAIKSSDLNTSPTTVYEDRYADKNKINSSARMFKDSLIKDSAAGLPGYLKQQDILRPLTPIMTARGDTFTVRSYGEKLHPTTGEVVGQAWCEALVQRVPEYVDETLNTWDLPEVGSLNEKMGRRLKIIRFRWLNSDDV